MKRLFVQLRSGLGNQLFQFSCAYYFASKYDYELFLAPAYYDSSFKRFFKRLAGREVREFMLPKVLSKRYAVLSKRELDRIILNKEFFPLNEEKILHPEFVKYFLSGQDIFLSGYWQRFVFVNEYLGELKKLIIPQFNLSKNFIDWFQSITINHVAIHIRRGDFLTNKAFGACTKAYYLNSIERIKSFISSPVFVVVTNDVAWVSENLKEYPFSFFVANAGRYSDLEEFFLLSSFHTIIISNSTFSWWSAVLGDANDKRVFCPSNWFLKDALQERVADLIPPGWNIIPNDLEIY